MWMRRPTKSMKIANHMVYHFKGWPLYVYGNCAGIILGILIADAILEVFWNTLGIIKNKQE